MFLIEVIVGNRWVPWDVADMTLRQVLEYPPRDNHNRPYKPHEWRARRILPCQRDSYNAEIRQIWQPD